MLYSGHEQVSPDGKLAVSPKDGLVRDARTGDVVHALGVVGDSISRASFSPDGRWLVTVHGFGVAPPVIGVRDAMARSHVRVRDAGTGKEAAYLPGVSEIYWSRDGSRFAYFEGSDVKVWDPASGKEVRRLPRKIRATFVPSGDAILPGNSLLVWSPDGQRLLEHLWDNQQWIIEVWNVDSWQSLHSLTTASWGRCFWDGDRLVADNNDGPLWTWDMAADRPVENRIADQQVNGFHQMIRSPDGRRWAELRQDKPLRIWDLAGRAKTYESLTCTMTTQGGWSPDARFFVVQFVPSWQAGVELTFVDTAGGGEPRKLPGSLTQLGWNATGDRFAIYGGNNLKIYDTITAREVFSCPKGFQSIINWSPDGRRLIVGDSGNLTCWDVDAGKTVFTVPGGGFAAWTGDGRVVASSRTGLPVTPVWMPRRAS